MRIEDSRQYYFIRKAGGEQLGPFNGLALKQLAESNEIQGESFVWTKGEPEWVKATLCDSGRGSV